MDQTNINIASYIDHTLLKADATSGMIEKLCQEANDHNLFSVCLNPVFLPLAKKLIQPPVKLCTVIGFPLGANPTAIKVAETRHAIENGADEIDMVINIGALKEKKYDQVANDIRGVVDAAQGKIVKVIVETCLLDQDEKIKICELIEQADAHFIKTSTGFSTSGADLQDIKLLKKHLNKKTKIKASGGIKNKEQALSFIQAGADRLGTSSSLNIIG